MDGGQGFKRFPKRFRRRGGLIGGAGRRNWIGIVFQRPAGAFAQLAATSESEVDGCVAGDGTDPGAELLGVPQQPQPAVARDKRFLGGFLGEVAVTEAAPGDGEDLVGVAFDEFAVPFPVTGADRIDGVGVGGGFGG
jgi:hypothetical protein